MQTTKLKILRDQRGSILTMFRSDSKVYESWLYHFSTIFYNSIKAWHFHKKAVLNYACIKGKVKLALFDDRKQSKSFGKFAEYILTPEDYFLITIPPFIWNGFKGLGHSESIVANCINLPHDENEMIRKDHDDKYFKYNWNK